MIFFGNFFVIEFLFFFVYLGLIILFLLQVVLFLYMYGRWRFLGLVKYWQFFFGNYFQLFLLYVKMRLNLLFMKFEVVFGIQLVNVIGVLLLYIVWLFLLNDRMLVWMLNIFWRLDFVIYSVDYYILGCEYFLYCKLMYC